MKKLNKYYVGAEHISDAFAAGENDDWTHPTEQAAINHAKELLAEDTERESVIIVKITHIVRRKNRPVIVQKVR